MLAGKYRVSCTLQEDTLLPPFKGSAFRGAFAGAFKKTVCAVRRSTCQECLLRQRCLYVQTFEPLKASDSSATAPNPYLIEPPLDTESFYPAGSDFSFNLLLLGNANSYLPYYILSLERMGQFGVGKKAEGKGPGRFGLDDVRMNGRSIYDPQSQQLLENPQPQSLTPEKPQYTESGSLTVRFLTPLRVKERNSLIDEVPFYVLIKAVLRRISTLFAEYGEQEPDLDYPGLVNRAKEVPVVDSQLYWRDFRRYSNRQESAMRLGGVVGSVTYSGSIGTYLPLLELARFLHIGKQTTFGLGLMEYEWQGEN